MRFFVIFLVRSVVDMNILCGRCFHNDLDERVQSRNVETLDIPSRNSKASRQFKAHFKHHQTLFIWECCELRVKSDGKWICFFAKKTMKKVERTEKDINQINKV